MTPEDTELLKDLLAATRPARFKPHFADRVMQRLKTERQRYAVALSDSLARMFYRLAPAALLMVVALFVFGAVNRSDASQSAIESALGLQAVTLDEAFTFDATYYTIDADVPNAGRES